MKIRIKDFDILIDKEDYEFFLKYKWNIYNARYLRITKTNKGQKTNIVFHREIMKCPKGMEVDHINRNPLDNRKSNLRICTHIENCWNRGVYKGKKYKGVVLNKRSHSNGNKYLYYKSQIVFNKKTIHLGSFRNPIDAAKAYDIAAKKLFGKFAVFNFTKEK